MPRVARIARAGMIFHVLNRGNDRRDIFEDPADYAALERVIGEALQRDSVHTPAHSIAMIPLRRSGDDEKMRAPSGCRIGLSADCQDGRRAASGLRPPAATKQLTAKHAKNAKEDGRES